MPAAPVVNDEEGARITAQHASSVVDLLFLAKEMQHYGFSRLSAVERWPMALATLLSGYDASSGCEDSPGRPSEPHRQ